MNFFQWENSQLTLYCYLQANASKNELCEPHDNRLKIRIKAPAVDGKANKELIAFLAKTFKVSKSAINIIQGETGRQKTVTIKQPTLIPDQLDSITTHINQNA